MRRKRLGRIGFRVLFAALTALILLPAYLPADDPKVGPVVLEIKGYVVPARQVTVVPKVAGQVAEMLIDEGARVKAGDVLAKLDSVEYELTLRIARAELRLAEAGVNKAKESAGKADVEMALAKVEIAKLHVEMAEHRLDGTVVRAPIDGVVLARRAEVGTYIDPRASQLPASLCDLADPRTMDVEIWVPEKDLARVAKGLSCLIRAEAFPQKTYRGSVHRLLPVADRARGAVGMRIRLEVPEKDTSLRPEMSAIVTIMAAS